MHGGIAQGAGQALMERAVYDGDGQMLTASFMDYYMPRADDLRFALRDARRPLDHQSAWGQGRGRSRYDRRDARRDERRRHALWRAYRIAHIDMPATPFAVFRCDQAVGAVGVSMTIPLILQIKALRLTGLRR